MMATSFGRLYFGWVFVLLAAPVITAFAQPARIDSVVLASKNLAPAEAIARLRTYLVEVGDPAQEAVIYDRVADAFLEQGFLDSAAVYAWHVLRRAPENNELCSRAYVRLGFISYQREAFDRAEDFYSRASRLLAILDDKPALLMSVTYEARIRRQLDRPEEALTRYQQALQLAGSQQEKTFEVQLNFEMAGVLRDLNKFSDAADLLKRIIDHSGWDSTRLALAWNELGRVYEDRGDFREALSAYRVMLDLVRDVDPFPGYLQVMRMYAQLDRLDSAARYADSSETAALASAQRAYLRDCYRERHGLARRAKDTVEAYTYLLKYKAYDDSLRQDEMDRNWQRIRNEQVISASEAMVRIAELESQARQQGERSRRNEERFLWITTVASLVAVVFLSLWFFNLRRARERVRDLEQRVSDLAAKNGKVFSALARELQGPMSIFSNLTRSMPSQLKEANPQETGELLKHLHRSTQEVQQSLHELLDWAVTQSDAMPFRPEFFSCRNLADQVVKELEPWAVEHGVAPMLLVPEHVTTYADRTMVRIVLRTLVYNAIRFSPEGGAVSLFSGKRDNLITLGVKDRGPGIEAGRQAALLEWSETGARERGVGLPMCRELVRRNGGDLFVESEVGQGSTFYFTLPENPPGVV